MKLPVVSGVKKLILVVFVVLLWRYFVDPSETFLVGAEQKVTAAAVASVQAGPVTPSLVSNCHADWVVTGIRPKWSASDSDHGLVQLISHYRQLGYTDPMISASIEQSRYLAPGTQLPQLSALATTDQVLGDDLQERWLSSIRQLAEHQGIAAVLDAYSDPSHPLFANDRPDVQQLAKYLLLVVKPAMTAEHLLRLQQLGLVVDLTIFKIMMMQPELDPALYTQLFQLYQGSLAVVLQDAFDRMSVQTFGRFVEMVLLKEPRLEFALDPLVQKLLRQQVSATDNAADRRFWQSMQQKLVILLHAGFQLKQQNTVELLQENNNFPPQLAEQLLNTAEPLVATATHNTLLIPAMLQQLTELKRISEQWPALEFVHWPLCGDDAKNLITYQRLKQDSAVSAASVGRHSEAVKALLHLSSQLERTQTPQPASPQTQKALLQPELGLLLQQLEAGVSQLDEFFAGATVWEVILSQHRRTPSQPDAQQVLRWAAELSATDSRAMYALATAKLPELVDIAVRQGLFNPEQQEMLAVFLLTEQQPLPSQLQATIRTEPLLLALKAAAQLRVSAKRAEPINPS